MMREDAADERERRSREEAIAYVESPLPDLVVLSASEPQLQHLLRVAHQEARQVVDQMGRARLAPDNPANDAA